MRKAGQKAPEIAKKRDKAEKAKKPLIAKDAPMTHGGKGGTKGTFTAAATKAGMGVQEYARKVLADDNASPKMKKKAAFAKASASWRH